LLKDLTRTPKPFL